MQPLLFDENFSLLLFILSLTNVMSQTNRWKLTGTIPSSFHSTNSDRYIKHQEIIVPTSFDSREYWSHCKSIGKVVDQGNCGSSWAVVTASTVTDRWCIITDDTFSFSAEDILTCCEDCVQNMSMNHCTGGGFLSSAVKFWFKRGVVSNKCKPYSKEISENGTSPKCISYCPNQKYKYFDDRRRGGGMQVWDPETSLDQIQIEIMRYGPVCSLMKVTEHFENNVGKEVYEHSESEDVNFTWHSVKIIGWGKEKGTPYWLVANSWGAKWGKLGGFFKILRGQNLSGIETQVTAPVVVSSSPSKNVLISVSSVSANVIFYFYYLTYLYFY